MGLDSRNKSVCNGIQTHFAGVQLTRFIKNILGTFFIIYLPLNKAVCCEAQTHFRSFRLAKILKNILGTLS